MKSKYNFSNKYNKLFVAIYDLYHLPENKNKLLYHGWHHINFVHQKTIEFARELKANQELAASASLLHDINYIFSNELDPEAVEIQILTFLEDSGYSKKDSQTILEIIETSHTKNRSTSSLSPEAKALADGDNLFKILPANPILFTSKFLIQNNYNIEKLAKKIIEEQKPLIERGIYFYTKTANKRYLKWAEDNLKMWENISLSFSDENVKEMLKIAEELKV